MSLSLRYYGLSISRQPLIFCGKSANNVIENTAKGAKNY